MTGSDDYHYICKVCLDKYGSKVQVGQGELMIGQWRPGRCELCNKDGDVAIAKHFGRMKWYKTGEDLFRKKL